LKRRSYHGVLHVAFRDAVKRRIIPANPVDQATRPKREQFIAGYYNVDEIKQLLELTKDDEIYLIILITAYCINRSRNTNCTAK